jgi:nuclear transport factor 2 (NTF2) superfamily protein
MSARPPLPPFERESAIVKVRLAEDGWNSRDPEKIALAYTTDSTWRNRAEFLTGREAIIPFLTRKWAKELEYRLIKELWAFHENRIAVRFAYEWHDDSGNWFRSYGNENWEFDPDGRSPDPRIRAQVFLAAGSAAGRAFVVVGAWSLNGARLRSAGFHGSRRTPCDGSVQRERNPGDRALKELNPLKSARPNRPAAGTDSSSPHAWPDA